MTAQWTARGPIDAASVTHIAVSPQFARDGTLVAATLAGVSISRDAGRSWETPARGIVGPFIGDLDLSPSFGRDGLVYATAPGGLFRSTDGGRQWQVATREQHPGVLAVALDGTLYFVPDGDACIWRWSDAESRCVPLGQLPAPPLALTIDARTGALWALMEEALAWSGDGGATWTAVGLPVTARCQALAVCGPQTMAIGTEEHGVLLRHDDGRWEMPAQMRDRGVMALGGSADGTVIAAGTAEGVFVSSDAGRTWVSPAEPAAVLSVAVAPDASHLFAGLAGGGCRHSTDLGGHWEELTGIDGTLVAALSGSLDAMLAQTADGGVLRSGDGGRSWSPAFPAASILVQAIAPDARLEAFALAAGDEVVWDGRHLHAPLAGEIRDLAIHDRRGAEAVLAVADAAEVAITADGGETWQSDTPPLEKGAEIVGITFGRPGNQAEALLAVAALTPEGMGELWVRAQARAWRRVAAQQAGLGGVRLAAVKGPRGLFAAIGDTVYRPARVGAMVYAAERLPDAGDAGILHLAATHEQAGTTALAALTSAGIYLSRDGGLLWSLLAAPAGPPVTAIALHGAAGGVEVVAAHIGGGVSAISLCGDPETPWLPADPRGGGGLKARALSRRSW